MSVGSSYICKINCLEVGCAFTTSPVSVTINATHVTYVRPLPVQRSFCASFYLACVTKALYSI